MDCTCTGFITPEGAQRLKKYQYKGEDRSYYYKYCLAPLANYCMNFTPYWLAPNLITFIGLMLPLITNLIIVSYSPQLKTDTSNEPPRILWLIAALSCFIYQTLDNMDGRQARRTGSSSPLGLLMDHGCDTFNVPITSISLCTALGVGPTLEAVALYFVGAVVFYFNTWEEYYTGELILAEVNGPSDGQLIIQGAFLSTFWFGPAWWLEESFGGFQRNTIFVLIALTLSTFTLGRHLINVVSQSTYKRMQTDGLFIALTRLLPFTVLNILFVIWIQTSPAKIFEHQPLLCLWTLAFLNGKLTIHLMIDHLCDEYHQPWRKTMSPFFFFAVHIILGGFESIDENLLLTEFFLLASASALHLCIGILREVSMVLEVGIFTIDTKKAYKLLYEKEH